MLRTFAIIPVCVIAALASCAAVAQSRGGIGIEQVPASGAPKAAVGVAPVDPSRSSATVQSPGADKVSAETLAECRQARAQDRPAPKGVDCLKALQVSVSKDAQKASPTAEVSLLGMLGQNVDTGGTASGGGTGAVSADQVARQLSSGDFQGTVGSDVAASVARDRPAPGSTSPR